MNINKKRSRSVNWDEEEKQLLRFVLRDHVNVIENKAINTNTIKLKNKAWEEVYKKFNELNGRHRNILQLKIQWKTMKLKARKRRKIKRELGEATPATASDAVIEIKDSYNPAETSIQNNLKPMAFVDTCVNDNINQQSRQIDDCIDTIDGIDALVDDQNILYTPLRISKDIFKDPQMEKNMGTIPVKTDHGDHNNMSCIIGHIKNLKDKEHKRRLEMAEEEHSLKIAIQKEKLKSATIEREILELRQAREDHDDHNNMICLIGHIKNLKDKENKRRLEMAEEEHSLKIAIQKEKLKSATLEREILELKQAREVRSNLNS